jgi:hypothetical protein
MNISLDELELFIEGCIRNGTAESYRINDTMYSFLGHCIESPLPSVEELPIFTNMEETQFKQCHSDDILKILCEERELPHVKILSWDEIHPYLIIQKNEEIHQFTFYIRNGFLYYTKKIQPSPR